jgi:hypothetical protein
MNELHLSLAVVLVAVVGAAIVERPSDVTPTVNSFDASFARPGEVCRYRFRVPLPSSVILETTGLLPTRMILSHGKERVAEDSGAGIDLNARIAMFLPPGTYDLSVAHQLPTGTGDFRLLVLIAPTGGNIATPDPNPPLPPGIKPIVIPPPVVPIPPTKPPVSPSSLSLLNSGRAKAKAPPFAIDARLSVAAQKHADDMAQGREPFGHAGFPERLYAAGWPRTSPCSEGCFTMNGVGWQYWIDWMLAPKQVLAREPHSVTFRSAAYVSIGIGYAEGPSGAYGVLDYGGPASRSDVPKQMDVPKQSYISIVPNPIDGAP